MKKRDEIITSRINEVKGDMTLAAFSKLLGVGMSTLHNYLRGRVPPASFIRTVSTKTGVSPAYLLGITENDGDVMVAAYRMEMAATRDSIDDFLKSGV